MRATFLYFEDGVDDDLQEVMVGTGDFVKAERHFNVTTEDLLSGGSIDHWTFLVHSRLSHLVKRGETPGGRTSMKPFNDFINLDVEVELKEVHTLAERLGNLEAAE